jgi:hypothetical protein
MASLNFPLHDHCQGSVHTNVRLATQFSPFFTSASVKKRPIANPE